ncbi:MAG: hypothetical protein RR500_03380 [Bacilli bacterium]
MHVYRYVTENTFDAYLYQLVENKQKFISQVMTSKSPVRSAEDIDESVLSYAEIKALASGNPKIKEKMDLDIHVNKLKMAKANYLTEKYSLEDQIIKYYPTRVQLLKEKIANYEKDISNRENSKEFSMTLFNEIYTEKEQAGNALLLACKQVTNTDKNVIGVYRNFEMSLTYNTISKTYEVILSGKNSYHIELGTDTFGNIKRIDNRLDNLEQYLIDEKGLLDNTLVQYKNAQEEVNKPFAKEEELQKSLYRLAELNKELDTDNKKDSTIVDIESSEEPIEYEKREMVR